MIESFSKKVINNLLKMFEYRKYERIKNKDTNDMMFLYDINKNIICVKFIDYDKINVDYIRIFIAYLDKNNINHGILISKNEPSIQIIKEIATLSIFFEIFCNNQLCINISEHIFVPKHILLTTEEAQKLKDDFNTPFSLFPKIKYNDAMARYIGAKIGDVIKIERNDETIAFRYVIK